MVIIQSTLLKIIIYYILLITSYTNFHKLFTHIHSNHTIFPLIQTTSFMPTNQRKSTPSNSHSKPNTTSMKSQIYTLFFFFCKILECLILYFVDFYI